MLGAISDAAVASETYRGRARILVGIAFALTISCLRADAREPWVEWKNCQLDENDSNDGDSFHIRAGGQEYICRLYFVDAPETDAGFPERVAEQGKYFGITPKQTIELGEVARTFTEETLAKPFTVRTRKQNAMGRSNKPRIYVLVQTANGGDLGEMLVANGMARVHGVAAAPPGKGEAGSEKEKLRQLERSARQLRIGGWGATTGRMRSRAAAAGKKVDSFETFFHPERAMAPPEPSAIPAHLPVPPRTEPKRFKATPLASIPAADDLLDPNTATVAELMKLQGIGPVLAGRIVEARPFKSADELRRVQGIGPKIYAKIRPHFERTD